MTQCRFQSSTWGLHQVRWRTFLSSSDVLWAGEWLRLLKIVPSALTEFDLSYCLTSSASLGWISCLPKRLIQISLRGNRASYPPLESPTQGVDNSTRISGRAHGLLLYVVIVMQCLVIHLDCTSWWGLSSLSNLAFFNKHLLTPLFCHM